PATQSVTYVFGTSVTRLRGLYKRFAREVFVLKLHLCLDTSGVDISPASRGLSVRNFLGVLQREIAG
ncbi:MAG TPA: hypothetical protein VEM15_12260, partial [Thermodesulfobacteriota bacterium]|nr:hypothetical protein [Thermodesulfobacteriota bacterium]